MTPPSRAWRALVAALLLVAGAEAGAQDATPASAPADTAPADTAPAPQWGRGPLEVRDPFILALARLSPWARSPEVLAHGQVELGLRGLWSNSHAFAQDRLVLDAEVRQAIPWVRVGLLDRLELGLTLPYEWRGGGALDGFIEGFHDAFGLPQQQRDRRPRDRYRVDGVDRRGASFRWPHRGYGLSDLVVEARGLLTAGGPRWPAVTATLRLRLPTGRPKFDLSDGVDASLALDVSKRLGDLPLVAYGSFAWTHHARARLDGLRLTRDRLFGALGLEWVLAPWASFVVHAWLETRRETRLFADAPAPPFGTPPPQVDLTYGNYVSYIAFGFRLAPTEGLGLDLGALQNLLDPDTTADFTWLAGVSYRF